MYRIVIVYLKKMINRICYDKHETDMLFKQIMINLSTANTLQKLVVTKKLLNRYKKIVLDQNSPPLLVSQYVEMEKIWLLKFKIWKHKDR